MQKTAIFIEMVGRIGKWETNLQPAELVKDLPP